MSTEKLAKKIERHQRVIHLNLITTQDVSINISNNEQRIWNSRAHGRGNARFSNCGRGQDRSVSYIGGCCRVAVVAAFVDRGGKHILYASAMALVHVTILWGHNMNSSVCVPFFSLYELPRLPLRFSSWRPYEAGPSRRRRAHRIVQVGTTRRLRQESRC